MSDCYEDDFWDWWRCAECHRTYTDDDPCHEYIEELDAIICSDQCYNDYVEIAQADLRERIGPLQDWEMNVMKLELRKV